MKKVNLTPAIDIDSCADFYDFCKENDIDFIVEGMESDPKDEKKLTAELNNNLTKLYKLLFKERKIRTLLAIITRLPEEEIKATIPEAKELLTSFFIELDQQSAGLMVGMVLNPTGQLTKTHSGK